MTQNFSKFIYLYEDNNQISIINLKLNELLDKIDNNINDKIILKIDNQGEVIPIIHQFSSIYDNDYKAENVLREEGYYCSKTNTNEFITFKFDKAYYFTGIKIVFPNRYKKAKLKELKINIYDINEKLIDSYFCSNDDFEIYSGYFDLNDKGVYIKFELLENFGEDYFCIKRIKFFAEISHSLK